MQEYSFADSQRDTRISAVLMIHIQETVRVAVSGTMKREDLALPRRKTLYVRLLTTSLTSLVVQDHQPTPSGLLQGKLVGHILSLTQEILIAEMVQIHLKRLMKLLLVSWNMAQDLAGMEA